MGRDQRSDSPEGAQDADGGELRGPRPLALSEVEPRALTGAIAGSGSHHSGMIELSSRARRNLLLLAVAVLVAWIGWKIRSVINPLILGYLLAFILQPAVVSLQRRGMKRSGAVVTVFGAAFLLTGVVGLAVFVQGRGFVEQFAEQSELGEEATEAVVGGVVGGLIESTASEGADSGTAPEEAAGGDRESSESDASGGDEQSAGDAASESKSSGSDGLVGSTLEWIESKIRDGTADFEDERLISALAAWSQSVGSSILRTLQSFFGGVFGLVTLLVMVPVYAFFWLFEMGRLNDYIVAHIPARHRERFVDLFTRLGEVLSVFFRGRLTVCLIKGLFLTAGLLLTGIPYALLLGIGGGFLSIIPFLGGIVAFLAAVTVALVNHGVLYALLASGIVFALAELLEGYVLMPRVLGESLGLSDVTVLFAITAGGALLGLFGVLIALPLAAAIKILYHEFVEPALEQFVEEDTASG